MRKIWSKSSKRRSMASLTTQLEEDSGNDASTYTSKSLLAGSLAESTDLPPVRLLARPEYDSKCVKHLWVNGVLNASSTHDFSEQLLRLYRVELRGSHLYVFRPPLQLNARLFKLELADPIFLKTVDSDSATDASTAYSLAMSGALTLKSPSVDSTPQNTALVASIHSGVPTIGHSSLQLDLASDSPQGPRQAPTLTYFLTFVPHPDLAVDPDTGAILASSSLEAQVHFFLFGDDASIGQIVSVFPMFPNFAEVLEFLHEFLVAISLEKFGKIDSNTKFFERVIRLFEHVKNNFCGFLLKSHVAHRMLEIIELLTEISSPETIGLVTFFKSNMLATQQILLDLVNYVHSSTSSAPSESPLLELNSTIFMNDINLFDLASAVTAIDFNFFKNWNSSIDKSLLLFSSLSETTQGNQFYKKNPLFFNNENHIHYLSRLLIHHLFLENSNASPEKRAHILERWIDLGCLLDKLGNMSSWLGISSIILSQPVLRLTNVWTHVSTEYVKLLKNDWSPVLFELDRRHLANSYEQITFGSSSASGTEPEAPTFSKESYHIMAPRGLGKIYPKEKVIPYFGDLLVNNVTPTSIAELDAVWRKINYSFDRWNDYLKNLYNSNEIIHYNQDVLRRYDSMSFIFSNESLNQVLYLGVNKDDEKNIPPSLKAQSSDTPSFLDSEENLRANLKLGKKLLRLLELNCDSMNLDDIMKLSLLFEPSLNESYLNVPPVEQNSNLLKLAHLNGSSLSVNSTTSSISLGGESDGTSATTEITADDKLPSFNNHYFSINLHKYDDLVEPTELSNLISNDKHSIVIDGDLTLRLDDFVSDFDTSSLNNTTIADSDNADDDGLGIDVDDILNSEKFKNFSISQDNSQNADATLEKKHRSFGLVSNHSNLAQHALSQSYIPRFATVDKLIDLLLIDSKYLDEAYPINLTEYRFVFMLNYNSFMTTKELLEKLAHRFVYSGNAVISVMKKKYHIKIGKYDPADFKTFPNWDVDHEFDLKKLGDGDYELLLKIQVNILKALIVLINNFFSNFSNDLKNKKIMIKLLKLYSNEILHWYNSNKIDEDLEKSFENLVNYYKRLKKLFVKKSYRPVEALKFEEFLIHEFKFSNSVHEVPMNRNLPGHKNLHKIEKFLNKFNKLLTVFYKGVTPENWFKTFKILENLFENHSLLNYDIQKSNVSEDHVVISNVMSYFDTLYDLSNRDLVLRKLPIVFYKLFKLYAKFKSYLLIQLCDTNMTTEERLDRMKTLLLMMKISKLKMAESQFVFDGDQNEIPSCIETAITNVIYSPESRTFAALWIKASTSLDPQENDFHKSFDTIDSLLPTNVKHTDLVMGNEPLLPCFGWIIENLLQVIKCPSYYRGLINFNKRYLIFKLIKELSVEDVDENDEFHNDTKEFEFLMSLDETLCNVNDLKPQLPSDRLNKRLFKQIIKDQYILLSAEGRKRAYRESRRALESGVSKEHVLTRKSSNTTLRRQSLSYKTNSSSRFKISGLFSKTRMSLSASSERVVDFRELPSPASVADPKMKPALVIQLKDRKIFPVYSLPNCFKMDHDNSNEVYFFQACSERESKEWLKFLTYANRHWFFSKSISSKATHTFTTFGIPLATICSRDMTLSPRILSSFYEIIENEGLKDVGIYRIGTSISELASIKAEIDKTGRIDYDKRGVDVHALTSCVKLYFRELPDAVLTDEVIELFYPMRQDSKRLNGESGQNEFDAESYKQVLSKLPKNNYHTLKDLVRHLNKVVQHHEQNRMNASNLATVIGPALTEASVMDSLINNFGVMNFILEKLIEHYGEIFENAPKEIISQTKEETPVGNKPDQRDNIQNGLLGAKEVRDSKVAKNLTINTEKQMPEIPTEAEVVKSGEDVDVASEKQTLVTVPNPDINESLEH